MPAAAPPDSLPASGSPAAWRAEWRTFATWLGCWVVLPNLPFLPVTLMGGPPRAFDIVVCAIVGLVARRWSAGLQFAAFAAVMTWLVVAFISRMFNMAPTMLFSVAGLLLDLKPQAAPEYLLGGSLLAVTLAAAAWLLRRPSHFAHPRLLLGAALLVSGLAATDFALARAAMGSYARFAPAGARFTSASRQVDLLGQADGRRNLLIVMVEAMGEPLDPAARRRLDSLWLRPELAERFTMRRGLTDYYASTTSGEIRELCQRWGDYPEIEGPQPGCLPAILRGRGYETLALHGFQPSFFERERWYPLIGFERMSFGQDMLDQGARYCPNVFPGACDRDVPRFIGEELRRSGKPKLVYWLTLNSHLPVVANRALGTENCKALGPQPDADFPMVCRLYAVWGDTAAALAKLLASPDLPPTDVLIVGDHMPPFIQQQARVQFDPDHVPWYYLRDKRIAAGAQSRR